MCLLSSARAQYRQMNRILDVVNYFKYLFRTVEINLISNLGINLSMSISVDYFKGVSPPFLATPEMFARFVAQNSEIVFTKSHSSRNLMGFFSSVTGLNRIKHDLSLLIF